MSGSKVICLNMIVKNESKVIRRCLDSVKEYIDYWVIVDTGSTDGTQQLIREILKDIPGQLFERPWKSFEFNRNEALKLAYSKGDYLFFIDADEELKVLKPITFKKLKEDIVLAYVKLPSQTLFHRQILISTKIQWFWKGVVHEQIYSNATTTTHHFLEDAQIWAYNDGGRTGSDSSVKFLHDAKVLEEALIKDPFNSRYVFYLSCSYLNARKLPLALKNYEKRTKMGGWDQEVFYSYYSIARIQKELQMDPEIYIRSFNKAYNYRPTRVEPLFWIANYHMEQKEYHKALEILKKADKIPLSDDAMMVEHGMYTYGIKWMLADCLFSLNKYEEAIDVYEKVVRQSSISEDTRNQLVENQMVCKAKLSGHITNGFNGEA